MTTILDQRTGKFRPLNREEQKREDRMIARMKENREWKKRAHEAEAVALANPNSETIAEAFKAMADWHQYATPSSRSGSTAVAFRKLATNEEYCHRVAELWKQYADLVNYRDSIAGMTPSPAMGGIRYQTYFDHREAP